MMKKVNMGTSYLLWCTCFLGLAGIHRFYTGNIVSGILYLFTWGFLGVGQVLDLLLIPGMVERRNIYLRGLYGSDSSSPNQQITLNIGDIPQLKEFQDIQRSAQPSMSPMQKLLKGAQENGGNLSLAQAAMCTELEDDELEDLLQHALKVGYANITNDEKTGSIRYHFDV